jgi:hypothetical protein
MPWGYVVVVRAGRLQLVSQRKSTVFMDVATSDIESIFVAETSSTPPWPQVTLGIILQIRSNLGSVELPVVPISEDGKRLLTWNDAEVGRLADRIRRAIELDRIEGNSSS